MKRKIRKGVFETNSSSVHAICVSNDRKYDSNNFPSVVAFNCDEFGWEYGEYSDINTKANYLYQAILGTTDSENVAEKQERIRDILHRNNIQCWFTDKNDGYIDHEGELFEWVDKCLNDEEYLLTYLLGDSFIITGNDNSDGIRDRMYEEVSKYNYELKPEFHNYDIYEKRN